MATEKERRELEYIRLVNYDDTISNLGDISGNIGSCMDNVPTVNELEKEKYNEAKKAKHAAREVLHIAKKLDSLLLKKKFGRLIHKREKSVVYIGKSLSDKEAVDISKDSLKNLKKNLEKMESHFKEM